MNAFHRFLLLSLVIGTCYASSRVRKPRQFRPIISIRDFGSKHHVSIPETPNNVRVNRREYRVVDPNVLRPRYRRDVDDDNSTTTTAAGTTVITEATLTQDTNGTTTTGGETTEEPGPGPKPLPICEIGCTWWDGRCYCPQKKVARDFFVSLFTLVPVLLLIK